MDTLHLLLGSAERRSAAVIEATVLDFCYNRAAVKTSKVSHIGDFVRQGCCGSFGLMILCVDHLLPDPRQTRPYAEALIHGVWAVKNRNTVPLICAGADPELEYRLLEAGADGVLNRTLDTTELRRALDRVLDLGEAAEEVAPEPKWSLSLLFSGRGRAPKSSGRDRISRSN